MQKLHAHYMTSNDNTIIPLHKMVRMEPPFYIQNKKNCEVIFNLILLQLEDLTHSSHIDTDISSKQQ